VTEINHQMPLAFCLPVLLLLLVLLHDASSSNGWVELDSGRAQFVSGSDVVLAPSSFCTLLVEGDEGTSAALGPGTGTRYSVAC
jgi:hypothetical protein